MDKRPVLITTKHRGVFFGYMNGKPDTLPGKVKLSGVKNCIYWSSDVGGFLGLASDGPSASCKIGKRVESMVLYDVTSVTDVSPEATELWESAVWKS